MGGNTVHALKNVNLDIAPDEFVAIMGRSGSGKSTLMHVLGLLDQPTSGSYRLFGKEVAHMEEDVARPLGRGDEAEAARGVPADDLAVSGHRWCGVFLKKKAIQRLIGKRKQLLF